MVEFESPLGNASFRENQRKVYTVGEQEQDVQQQQGYMRRQPPMEAAPTPSGGDGANRGFGGGVGGLRELTKDERLEMEEKRRQARNLMERVSPQARQRIEFLCGLGRLKDEVTLDDTTFKLRSLKSKELKEILMAIADVSPLVLGIELRNQTLARSVYEIDGQPIDLVLGTSSMEARVSLWDEMDDHASEFVHEHYQKLANEAKEKYGIHSREDASKVVEDIKKS